MSQLEQKVIGYAVQKRKVLDESDLFYHTGVSWETVNQSNFFPHHIVASQAIGVYIYYNKARAGKAIEQMDTEMGSVEFRVVPVFGTIEGI